MPVRPALPPREDRRRPTPTPDAGAAARARWRSTPSCGAGGGDRRAAPRPRPADAPFAVHTADNGTDLPGRAGPGRGRRRRPGTRRSTRRTSASRRRWRCSPRSSAARRTTEGRAGHRDGALRAGLRQRLLGRHAAGVRRRRRHRSSTGSPSRSTCSATSSPTRSPSSPPNLTYQGQSGALNESVSDVFGSCLKQRLLGRDRRPRPTG